MLTIAQQLNTVPELSGSYQFFDKTGEIIYVGKAKNLKRRVSSYFHKKHDTPKLQVMVPQIVKIEFIVTDSEVEALILESHLIKKYKPKYNVLLKDDKKFPYFFISYGLPVKPWNKSTAFLPLTLSSSVCKSSKSMLSDTYESLVNN